MEIDLKKIPDKKYFTTAEVSKIVGAKAHTLRYWEREFDSLFKLKKLSNKRVFKKKDVINLLKIKSLLKNEGMTIKGAKTKINAFENSGIKVMKRVPLLSKETVENKSYIKTKKDKSGHFF